MPTWDKSGEYRGSMDAMKQVKTIDRTAVALLQIIESDTASPSEKIEAAKLLVEIKLKWKRTISKKTKDRLG